MAQYTTYGGNAQSAVQKLDIFFGSLGANEQHAVANMVRSALQGSSSSEVALYEADSFEAALTSENAPLLTKALGLP